LDFRFGTSEEVGESHFRDVPKWWTQSDDSILVNILNSSVGLLEDDEGCHLEGVPK